jgi:hypothetical protein
MFSISVKPQQQGFALFIEAPEGVHYQVEFCAIGPGGREAAGLLEGITANGGTWRHEPVAFPVLRVGITDVHLAPQATRRAGVWTAGAADPRRPSADPASGIFRSSADAAFMATGSVRHPTAEKHRPNLGTIDKYPGDTTYSTESPYISSPYISDTPYPLPYGVSSPNAKGDMPDLGEMLYPFEGPYPGGE